MTVSYQSDVASSTSGGLFRLLWRWRGSVWKLVYMELFAFLAAYVFLAVAYDFLMPDWMQRSVSSRSDCCVSVSVSQTLLLRERETPTSMCVLSIVILRASPSGITHTERLPALTQPFSFVMLR